MKKFVLGRGATKRIVKRGTPIKRDGRQTIKKAERAKRLSEKASEFPPLETKSFVLSVQADASQKYVSSIGEAATARVVESVALNAATQTFRAFVGFEVADAYQNGAIPFVASVTADADGLLIVTTKYLVPVWETVELAAPGALTFETTSVVAGLPNIERVAAVRSITTESATAYVPAEA